jgi:DedD protein
MSYYDQHDDDFSDTPPQQREVTLSTLSIVGIFFGLALVCAVCFGLGYNMGSKARTAAGPDTSAQAASETDPNALKPSAGAPAIQPVPGYLSQKQADAANSASTQPNTPATESSNLLPVSVPTAHQATTVSRDDRDLAPATAADAPVAPEHSTSPHSTPTPAAAPAQSGSVYVQVAAVSHQEDAELLVSALHQKGYAVVSRTQPGDHFFHVQIGPFASKPAATPTLQRLQSDGYNAYIK